jgi:hypothetical protein
VPSTFRASVRIVGCVKNDPTKHHYTPVFYLRGFTADGSPDTKLFVHDVTTGKRFHQIPKNTGFQNQMYRVDADGIEDPNILERAFNEVEGPFGVVLAAIRANRVVPGETDFNVLLNFVALQFARVPAFKEMVNRTGDQISRLILKQAVVSKERFEQVRAGMLASGVASMKSAKFEEIKEFIDRGEFTFEASQAEYAQQLIQGMNTALSALGQRSWKFFFCDDVGSSFICSDNPVYLQWTTDRHPKWMSPGLLMPDTVVFVPLTKNILFYGTFEGDDEVLVGNRKLVGAVNKHLLERASRFVLSEAEDFDILVENDSFGSGRHQIEQMVVRANSEDEPEA